jgi:predicted transcriptional regulator
MLNNKTDILKHLSAYGLSLEQAKIYLCLLDSPASHLEISRKTGINRSKVYRIIDDLEALSLVKTQVLDSGRLISASNPKNLEVILTTRKQQLENQEAVLAQALPTLESIFTTKDVGSTAMVINTYSGTSGFKQMLWNELKANKELLIFGCGGIEDLVGSKTWADKHRLQTIQAGYTVREILNPETKPLHFTKIEHFEQVTHTRRDIDPEELPLNQQVAIYNNTVNIYSWQNGQKVGLEIISKNFAKMQRAIFEHYWQLAKPTPKHAKLK